MSARAERIKFVIESPEELLPQDKIIKLMNDFLLWGLITVGEYDTLNALISTQ